MIKQVPNIAAFSARIEFIRSIFMISLKIISPKMSNIKNVPEALLHKKLLLTKLQGSIEKKIKYEFVLNCAAVQFNFQALLKGS